MFDDDLYAAPPDEPEADIGASSEGRFWREGRLLVLEHGAHLPRRCLLCNGVERLAMYDKELHYYPWGWPLRRQEKAWLSLWLCQRCYSLYSLREKGLFFVGMLIGTSYALAAHWGIHPFGFEPKTAFLFVCIVVVPLIASINAHWLTTARINATEVRVRGVSRKFLAELPTRD